MRHQQNQYFMEYSLALILVAIGITGGLTRMAPESAEAYYDVPEKPSKALTMGTGGLTTSVMAAAMPETNPREHDEIVGSSWTGNVPISLQPEYFALSRVQLQLADGGRLMLIEYPVDLALGLESMGTTGVTEKYAEAIRRVADQLATQHRISPEEAQALTRLSKAAYKVSRNLADINTALINVNSGTVEMNEPVQVPREALAKDLASLEAAWTEVSRSRALSDPAIKLLVENAFEGVRDTVLGVQTHLKTVHGVSGMVPFGSHDALMSPAEAGNAASNLAEDVAEAIRVNRQEPGNVCVMPQLTNRIQCQ